MLRKTHVGIASILLSAPCFSGLYVGAAIGPETAKFTQQAHVQRVTVFNLMDKFNVIDKNRFSGMGFLGTIFAGVSYIYKQIYAAAEVNGAMSSVEYKLTNDEYIHQNFSKTTFTVKNSYGLSLLPGFLISPTTVFYGRVGIASGKIRLHESDPTIQSASDRRNGFRWGLGVRHAFTDQFSFMMDFSTIMYKSLHSFVFEPQGGVTKATKIKSRTGQVAFGLIYRFDAPLAPVYVK